MAVRDFFSSRGKPVPPTDVLKYDVIPVPLKVQIVQIWVEALGVANDYDGYSSSPAMSAAAWDAIVTDLRKEHAVCQLMPNAHNPFDEVQKYFLRSNPVIPIEHAMDVLEATFGRMEKEDFFERYSSWDLDRSGISVQPAEAITEVNHRFLQHGIGFQYTHGKMVNLNSTYMHAEVVKPALAVLANRRFANAQAEFLLAHEAYRQGRYSDSLNESLKAFESTMKIILTEKKWSYDPVRATAKPLIEALISNGLIPTSAFEQMTNLAKVLETGTPTTRNRNAGHGQGPEQRTIPDYIAAYGVQTAAANISLLVTAFERHT